MTSTPASSSLATAVLPHRGNHGNQSGTESGGGGGGMKPGSGTPRTKAQMKCEFSYSIIFQLCVCVRLLNYPIHISLSALNSIIIETMILE